MSDDIVTRLREKYSGQLPICIEAADEIERLRAELERLADDCDLWRGVAKDLAQHLQKYVCLCNMHRCKCGYDDVMDAYEEALRSRD